MEIIIDEETSPFYGEPSPQELHRILISFGSRVQGIKESYSDEFVDMYKANGLYGILIAPIYDGASKFYERNPDIHEWRPRVGPAIIRGLILPEFYMMWVPDSHGGLNRLK